MSEAANDHPRLGMHLQPDQVDKIEHLLSHYAEMLSVLAQQGLRMRPGPEQHEVAEHIKDLERVFTDVTEFMMPEVHAQAKAAKEEFMRVVDALVGLKR